jgi:hypothetical protein
MDDTQVPILPTDEDNQEERQEKLGGDYTRPFRLLTTLKALLATIPRCLILWT